MKVETILKNFGRQVSLHSPDGSQVNCKAFIQPLRYKNKMYLDGVYTQIGFNSQGHYLYIGPPEPDLTIAHDEAFLKQGETKYQIDRAERVYNGEEIFYIWAIIRTIVEVE